MNKNNFCIIMAGGYGSRFWPMSKANNPKQFLDILGSGESMLQTTFRRCERFCPRENIIIVTGELYAEKVRQQIPGLQRYQVLSEPTRRNTAPCVAYAASIIHELNPNANVVVTPSDHAVFGEDSYVRNLEDATTIVQEHDWIITVGVRPTNPNTKYGYIQFGDQPSLPQAHNLHKVITFTEKPPLEMARQFIASGEFFWNTGVFVWRLPVLMKAYETFLPKIARDFFSLGQSASPAELDRTYSLSEAISIDFGIMEKATNVHVMEAAFGWSDVETWDSLYNTGLQDNHGNVVVSGNVMMYDVNNCVVHVPQKMNVVIQGLDNYIVAGDDDTVLICRRDNEDQIFRYASDMELDELTRSTKNNNEK